MSTVLPNHSIELTPEMVYDLFENSHFLKWQVLLESGDEFTDEEEMAALTEDAEHFCDLIKLDRMYAPVLAEMFIDSLDEDGWSPGLE